MTVQIDFTHPRTNTTFRIAGDASGWSVGKLYTTKNKSGDVVEILQQPTYYPRLSLALRNLCERLADERGKPPTATITSIRDYIDELERWWAEIERIADLPIDNVFAGGVAAVALAESTPVGHADSKVTAKFRRIVLCSQSSEQYKDAV